MKNLHLLLFLLLISVGDLPAQDFPYARQVVDTLAGPAFYGRGYVTKGDQKAAAYIAEQFEQAGLKPIGKKYLQRFSTDVNTFPGDMQLTFAGKELKPGEDFIIDPASPGIAGTYGITIFTVDELLQPNELMPKLVQSKGKFLIIPVYNPKDYSKEDQTTLSEMIRFLKYDPRVPAAGSLTLTKDKLTWSGSTWLASRPNFTVLADSLPETPGSLEIEVENEFIKNYKTQNVAGKLEGQSNDSLIVFTAHYDHLGMMGTEAMFPGANDNASGVAMLLNLARYFAENPPKYDIAFIAFGAEELGLLGSKYFVENPMFPLEKIHFLLNFDISGTGDDGIQVVNGSVYKKQFDRLQRLNEEKELLAQVKIRGESCNSDHCMFHQMGVPSFFIYTLGGIQAYHDIYDRPETLPLTEFGDYFKLIVEFAEEL